MNAEPGSAERIFTALAAEEVRVILIGGLAAVLHGVPGIGDYEQVERAAVLLPAFGLRIPTLDLPALITSKREAGRPKDLLALPQIEATLRLRSLE